MTNWHQQNARRIAYENRNEKAHILAPDYIATGKTLCGYASPSIVYVAPEHAHNPKNNVCPKCLSKLRIQK